MWNLVKRRCNLEILHLKKFAIDYRHSSGYIDVLYGNMKSVIPKAILALPLSFVGWKRVDITAIGLSFISVILIM
jgi:hypothetical protein